MDPISNFEHQHFAHCESGIMSTLLKYKGLELSEPMIFGLAGAICFAYLPFLKMGNMPLVSYRMFPGHIIKNIPRRLGVEYFRKTYKIWQLVYLLFHKTGNSLLPLFFNVN